MSIMLYVETQALQVQAYLYCFSQNPHKIRRRKRAYNYTIHLNQKQKIIFNIPGQFCTFTYLY